MPKKRFVIDEKSMRGVYSESTDIRTFAVLVDGQDRGIRLRTADYGFDSSASIYGETVVTGLRGTGAVLAWLEENLAGLPPLRTEQLEMEI